MTALVVPTLAAACAGRSGPCVQISHDLSIAPQGDSRFLQECKAIVAKSPDAQSAAEGVVALTSRYYAPDGFLAEIDDPLVLNVLDEYFAEQKIMHGGNSVEGGG